MSASSSTNNAPAAFVIGHPIAHSRSPILHGHWLKRYGIKGSYKAVDVAPDELAAFTKRIREGEFVGGNVTIPHKLPVFDLVDEVYDDAIILGAANTLWMNGNQLCATNTDSYGFLANLDASAKGWDENASSNQALVIGAGGASRAIIHGLISRGFNKVIVANRTLSRVSELQELFGSRIEPAKLEELQAVVSECCFVVNTSSLGMGKGMGQGMGQDQSDDYAMFIDNARDGTIVTDIVYTPLLTSLLERAQARGLQTVDGLGMLLHQAVPGFELWFGIRPQVDDELRKQVLNPLSPMNMKDKT